MRELARLTDPIRPTLLRAVLADAPDDVVIEIRPTRPPQLVFLTPADPVAVETTP